MPPAKLSPWLSTQGASRPAAGSYQVFSQPVFAAVERSVCHRKELLATTGRWGFRIITRSLCGLRSRARPLLLHGSVFFHSPSTASPWCFFTRLPACRVPPQVAKAAFRLTPPVLPPRHVFADVAVVCFIAIALPFFSDFVGLIGALGFWPGEGGMGRTASADMLQPGCCWQHQCSQSTVVLLVSFDPSAATVLFPIEMYRKLHKPGKWHTVWLESVNVFCCLITVRGDGAHRRPGLAAADFVLSLGRWATS